MFEFFIAFLFFLLWHGMGVTIGYHRLLSHRTFVCAKLTEYFWVLGGMMALEGSPIWWTTIHRAHHRYVDTVQDPHSPRFGLLHAWTGWTKSNTYSELVQPQILCPDLCRDRFYKWLDCDGSWERARNRNLGLSLALRLLLLGLLGWQIALASLLAGVITLQIPLMLNVVCHIPKLGYRTYARSDDSVNVWWVALLAFGEGWHNNHHAFPGSARTGMKWFELDLSWLMIRLMRALGLAKRVRDAKELLKNQDHEVARRSALRVQV